MDGYFGLFVLSVLLITPIVLTVINIFILLKGRELDSNISKKCDGLIYSLGIPLTAVLYILLEFKKWDYQFFYGETLFSNAGLYEPIYCGSMPFFTALCIISFTGYFLLRIKMDKLPPLVAVICHSAMFIGMVLMIVFVIQIINHSSDTPLLLYYLIIFPINHFICCVRLLRGLTWVYAERFCKNEYDNKIVRLCCKFLGRSYGFVLSAFLMAIPLLMAAIFIILLFGQKPDAFLRMFTETAEWTFSQKTPPPRLTRDGHYLCTVAAFGDKEKVKPIRQGVRYGQMITVNRQLLVANAFEDLIRERTPGFHKTVRCIYDKYGYPLAHHITTVKRANFVYYMMKPLEWLFVIILYTFDVYPENRISVQYTGKNWRNNKIV